MDGEGPAAGLLRSLRTLAADVLGGTHDRIELFALELQEEKVRAVRTLCWLGGALMAGFLAVVFASVTIVCLLWETARFAALGGLTAVFAVACALLVFGLRRQRAREPRPFAATRRELNQDCACLRRES